MILPNRQPWPDEPRSAMAKRVDGKGGGKKGKGGGKKGLGWRRAGTPAPPTTVLAASFTIQDRLLAGMEIEMLKAQIRVMGGVV